MYIHLGTEGTLGKGAVQKVGTRYVSMCLEGFFTIPLSKDLLILPVRRRILHYSSLKGLLDFSSPTKSRVVSLRMRKGLGVSRLASPNFIIVYCIC